MCPSLGMIIVRCNIPLTSKVLVLSCTNGSKLPVTRTFLTRLPLLSTIGKCERVDLTTILRYLLSARPCPRATTREWGTTTLWMCRLVTLTIFLSTLCALLLTRLPRLELWTSVSSLLWPPGLLRKSRSSNREKNFPPPSTALSSREPLLSTVLHGPLRQPTKMLLPTINGGDAR